MSDPQRIEISITCQYCGVTTYEAMAADKFKYYQPPGRCGKCGDKNLVMKDVTADKINAYEGCPPFPEKVEKPSKEKAKEQINNDWPLYHGTDWSD